jgi:hypothetical protein
VDLDSCFPTQAELGWGAPFRAEGCFVKEDLWFPTLSAEKTERMGHGTFSRIEASFPTQAELGWGNHFGRIEAARNADPFIRP